jgi:beta-mannosidase
LKPPAAATAAVTLLLLLLPQVAGAIQESYYFKVNGVPIYFKGANVIPLSILPSNVTAELTQSILQAAVESHQNLLRVWGGGLYHVSAVGHP